MVSTPPRKISALVLDDEPPARQRVADLLLEDTGVGRVRECAHVADATDLLTTESIDVAFVDIHMPGLSGLDFARGLTNEYAPLLVFVTAFNEHAVDAFDVSAFDFLSKPFSDERFERTMVRVHQRIRERDQLRSDSAESPRRFIERLAIRSRGEATMVVIDDIVCADAAGVYLVLHLRSGETVLHRSTVSTFIAQLDPACFVRIHRSTIVNLRTVSRIEAVDHGDAEITLTNGMSKRVSRTFRKEVEQALEKTRR